MKNINNVLLCGLGSIGCVCAVPIYETIKNNLKILIDKDRLKRYKETPTVFNGRGYDFEYITPDNTEFKADLVIIATKYTGLKSAIADVKNFVKEDTIIVSLLNGINSEEEISKVYEKRNIPLSFYIGESGIRNGRTVTQSGNYKIIIGAGKNTDKNILPSLSEFFDRTGIHYELSEDMEEEYLKKFMINVGVNQLCASEKITLKEIRKDENLTERLKNLIFEVKEIARVKGISNYQKIYDDAVKFLLYELKDATPSMLQDVLAKRQTEVEMFAGRVMEQGRKYNVKTPENRAVYEKITGFENEYLTGKE